MDKLHLKGSGNTVVDEKNRMVLGIVGSTGVIDRYGESVNPMGWKLENYMKDPVILYGHDYSSFPVGKALKVYIEDNKLKFDIQFADTDEGIKTFNLIKGGFLNTTSVGFIPMKWGVSGQDPYTIMEQELLELSVVPVPANPEALIQNSLDPLVVAFKKLGSLMDKMKNEHQKEVDKKEADEKAKKEAEEKAKKEADEKIQKELSDLKSANETLTKENAELKEGRVLSEKNRGLIKDAISQMKEAITALDTLLSATEPKEDDEKAKKSADLLQSVRDIMRNNDKKLGLALKTLNDFVAKN